MDPKWVSEIKLEFEIKVTDYIEMVHEQLLNGQGYMFFVQLVTKKHNQPRRKKEHTKSF